MTKSQELSADMNFLADGFTVFYQPRFLVTGEKNVLIGVEALLRRSRSVTLPIQPFIQEAERTGNIVPLTYFVIRKACCDMEFIKETLGVELNLSINLSPAIFQKSQFIRRSIEIAEESISKNELLEFEITESHPIKDVRLAVSLSQDLREKGFGLAIDDFGIGLSGFLRLDLFPITTIKLDKYFVAGIGLRKTSEIIICNTIKVANDLGLNAVAEGVENKLQLDFIKNVGFKEIQGFYLGKPMPLAELINIIPGYHVRSHSQQILVD